MTTIEPDRADVDVDVVVVGAGFSGLYLLHRLRERGLSVRVLEAGDGVGGTWFWNRYPGARCDIESLEYGFSFSGELDEEWEWQERYAAQPEILSYLERVADKFDLRRDIQLSTRVAAAAFDEVGRRWGVRCESGEELSARFLVMATGCLSQPKALDIPGLETFAGSTYHTSSWPRDGVDFRGLRVGVIGTGSSGIQVIPQIAESAAHLTVFQRTPNYSIPAHNHDLGEADRSELAARREKGRNGALGISFDAREINGVPATSLSDAERTEEFERRWNKGGLTMLLTFPDLMVDERANATIAAFIEDKIRATVKDPAAAAILTPKGYPVGSKRLCTDTGYYETFNRDDVTLVDLLATPIQEVTPAGVRTSAELIELDALVMATGFDAITGALTAIEIRGRNGLALTEKWASGPHTYLGLSVAGFPNLFVVTGPGSPSVLSNMRLAIEEHGDWITECIGYLTEHDIDTIEATEEAETQWVSHVAEVGAMTLFPRAPSWYVGANVPGKPQVFLPYVAGVPVYRKTCAEVAASGYRGFALARE